ncbi:hypothetical protein PF003_g18233 [Phytophthora fragariae]|nr:hypothetical protein PF003_g18233 [Phytophthora fragariae]
MDQTSVCVDMNPHSTIEFVGARTVDVIQSMTPDSFRASVFLCASATGRKLRPMIVFAGTPGAVVHNELKEDKRYDWDKGYHTVNHGFIATGALMLLEAASTTAVAVAAAMGVDRSTLHRCAVNGFRVSVFLAASATGDKLPPFVVFAGMPGGPVSQEVFNPAFGAAAAEHTVQKNAYCDATVMLDWIERPSVDGCKLLILDSLRTHKMASVRYALQQDCCTQVEFVPPGVTGICQPMDVSVMKAFKNHIT